MSTLFSRAHSNLPLSPTERAILKLFYGAVGTAALTGVTAAVQYLASNSHNINWSVVLTVFLGAFGATLIETGRKYVTAHGDGSLEAAQQLLAATLQKAATTATTAPKTPTASR